MSYMTEEQAQEKWCPYGQNVAGADGSIYDNRGQSHGFTRCIASYCAAWRWAEVETSPDTQTVDCGYCGLAGKPEGGSS